MFGLSVCLSAQTVTTYTSLQSWQAAVTAKWQFLSTFGSIAKDTPFQSASVNLGAFSIQQVGKDPNFGYFRNIIDFPPLQFTDNDGSTNASLFTKNSINTVEMEFNAPLIAWGANFYGAQTGELLNLVLTGPANDTVATVPVTVNTGFFGFIITQTTGFSGLTFESQLTNPDPTVGQGFSLENITGAYFSAPTLLPSSKVLVTASGLVYSRVTQTFSCTITVKNVTTSTINGPFELVLSPLPSGVSLLSSSGSYLGNPFVLINTLSLGSQRSTTFTVAFSNPSNKAISLAPSVYAGQP